MKEGDTGCDIHCQVSVFRKYFLLQGTCTKNLSLSCLIISSTGLNHQKLGETLIFQNYYNYLQGQDMLLSYDKSTNMRENKCSQPSFKNAPTTASQYRKTKNYIWFIIQQIPSLSPEISLISFIRRGLFKKKRLKEHFTALSFPMKYSAS